MNERIFAIKDLALKLAEQANTEVLFRKARRKSDLAYFTLYGERRRVLAVAAVYEDIFKTEDLEIIHSNHQSERYALTLVVTEKIERQTGFKAERRKKLLLKHANLLGQKPTTPD